MAYILGRNPSPPDPNLLMMSSYMDVTSLPPSPKTTSYRKPVKNWGAMLNDRLGCCSVSGLGHLIQLSTANESSAQFNCPDKDILSFYSAVSGYDGRPSTDRGSNMKDCLDRRRNVGLSGYKDIGYVGVDPRNLDQVRSCLWIFGGLYGGCTIYRSWLTGDWSSGSGIPAGGHAWALIDRDGDDFIVMTWGELRRFTLKAWTQTMMAQPNSELYAIKAPEWTVEDGIAPSGFNSKALDNDLARLAGQPLPWPEVPPTPTPTPVPTPPPTPMIWLPPQSASFTITLSGPDGTQWDGVTGPVIFQKKKSGVLVPEDMTPVGKRNLRSEDIPAKKQRGPKAVVKKSK